MSVGSDTDKGTGSPNEPDDDALAAMSTQELLELGGKMDGVETVFKESRWPVEAPRPKSAPSAAWRSGFCWAEASDWRCC